MTESVEYNYISKLYEYMAKIGYARVSTVGQSLEVQLQKLQEAGCEKIYHEKISGNSTKRPELDKCLDYVRDGDTLLITKLDRLARSMSHLSKIVDTLNGKQVGFSVIDQSSINTETPTGKLAFNMIGAFAEFEQSLRKERQMEGIRASTKKAGRKRKFSDDTILAISNDRLNNLGITEIMRKYKISKDSVYRLTNNLVEKK